MSFYYVLISLDVVFQPIKADLSSGLTVDVVFRLRELATSFVIYLKK